MKRILLFISCTWLLGFSAPVHQERAIATVELDSSGIRTEAQFVRALQNADVAPTGYANWFTGRWPNISFIGGMVMGNVSTDLEFFYEKPFRWWSHVLDYVMDRGGRKYGVRAHIRPYSDAGVFPGRRSYLLWYRCDTLLSEYHPSYILVNGRRVWDSKTHPLLDGKILVPFWQEQAGNPVVDFVVDLDYTPEVKGLAFRMFNTQYLGKPGDRVTLMRASGIAESSPAEGLERFAFGLYPSGYDFWSERGTPIAELKRRWEPNFRPAYPTDELFLSPFVFEGSARGAYYDFMVSHGGCNVLGAAPGDSDTKQARGPVTATILPSLNVEAARRVLSMDTKLQAHWFGGEEGMLASDRGHSDSERQERLQAERDRIQIAKQSTGAPDRVKLVYEPFPPALTAAHEYERGRDILILKNEEDPQYNVLMAMARGAGRTFGKPFGFYWEQTHYPFPSVEFKLQACMLYYLCGGSWIGAEAEQAPSFARGIVAEWVMPYVKALRFAMVHPARGKPIVPIGIAWSYGDRWWAPYNPFGQMDTFQRHIEYDHETRTLKCEPAFVKRLPYVPEDRRTWNFQNSGHLGYFIDHVNELKGYDLLDVFFPHYGDAFTARIARLLTGTPYGPVDFVYANEATARTLQTYRLLAFLGHAAVDRELAKKLEETARAGSDVLIGAQHLGALPGREFLGLQLASGSPGRQEGLLEGLMAVYPQPKGRFTGRVYHATAGGWERVAWIGRDRSPLILRRHIGKGAIYVYLGEWIGEGGAALRPLLRFLGQGARPLSFEPPDDQLEYVAYRKNGGAWLALFNHGAIPVGCDRLGTLRAVPPEPLCSVVKGPWRGEISIRLSHLGLDPARRWAVYEVKGIDGSEFEQVISGRSGFTFREIPTRREGDRIKVKHSVAKRAELCVAPPGAGKSVFLGPP